MAVFDLLYIFVFLMVFSTCTIIAFMLLGEVGPILAALNPTSAEVIASANTAVLAFDSLFVFMTFGMIAASLLLAYMVDSHPVMFVASFIVFIFVVMISGILSNIYGEIIISESLASSAASYPLMTQIWMALPTIATIAGVAILIVAYAKYRSGGNIYGNL